MHRNADFGRRPDDERRSTPRLYKIPEAMRLLSISRSVIYEQIRAGRLKSVRLGRARLVPASAIDDYVALLLREADDGAA
jgi:excisionase family DNA binding protein